MLNILGNPQRTCHGISRRQLLQIGGAGLLGLSLPKLQAAESSLLSTTPRAKSILFIFLYGGPSQLETFDMKPDAASNIRGPFNPIASRTPDLRICEHLPRLANQSDQYAVVRTVNHPQNDHNGTHFIQTGHPLPPAANRGAANVDASNIDWPNYGSVVDYLDQQASSVPPDFPRSLYLPKRLGHWAGYDINGQYAGWLGANYNPIASDFAKRDAADNPFFRNCTDEELKFNIEGLDPLPGLTLDRLSTRESLLQQFETGRRTLNESPSVRRAVSDRSRAYDLLNSSKIRTAFDIHRESPALRDRYGRNLFGQTLLLGRRMIEAGARFVTVAWDLPVSGDNCGSWDMHDCLVRVMRDHLLPGLDLGLSALLNDTQQSGLLDETRIFVAGEMGRTPQFKNRGADDGRDHWSYCFPALFAGAGIRGGTTYGLSDKDAAYPIENPVSPADLACTLYHSLGFDPHAHLLHDPQGRPQPLVTTGHPLTNLFN